MLEKFYPGKRSGHKGEILAAAQAGQWEGFRQPRWDGEGVQRQEASINQSQQDSVSVKTEEVFRTVPAYCLGWIKVEKK